MSTTGYSGTYRSPAARALIAGDVGVGKSSLGVLLLSLARDDLSYQMFPRVGRVQNENETEKIHKFPVAAVGCDKPAFWLIDPFGSPSQGQDDLLKYITRLSNGWLNAGDKAKSNNVWSGWDSQMRPDCVVWMHRIDNANWDNIDDLISLASVINEHESKRAIVIFVSFSVDFGNPNVVVQGISQKDHDDHVAVLKKQCQFLRRNLRFEDLRDIPIDEDSYRTLLDNDELCSKVDKLLALIVGSAVGVRREVLGARLTRANPSASAISANRDALLRGKVLQDQRVAAEVRARADERARAEEQALAEARAREAAELAGADADRIAQEAARRKVEIQRAQAAVAERRRQERAKREQERAAIRKENKASASASSSSEK